MEFKKPEVTKKQERIDKTIAFFKRGGYITKKEIADELGLLFPKHDRQIRDIVAEISQTYPIISTSDTNRGYKMAQSYEDVEGAKHSLLELISRMDEIRKRNKPLSIFLNKFQSPINLFD